MRIAIDISQIIHEGSGVARYTRNLVETLLALDQNNDYILFGYSMRKNNVLTEFYQSCRKLYRNVSTKLFFFPQTAVNTIWNGIHSFPLESLIGKVDIFHSSDWIQPPTLAKKVTTVHDMIAFLYPHYSHPTIIHTQKRRMGWVEKECDAVIADSKTTKSDILKLTTISNNRIHVIYPGIENKFKKIPSKNIHHVKRRYGIESQYFLTVGTQEPRKNTRSVVEAYSQFRKKMGEKECPSLVIVGKLGWGNNAVETPGVQLLGYVNDDDLPALYSGAQAFIYPSYYEGFGLPVLEAMACKCPVISSDMGSLSELVRGCAIIVDPKDTTTIVKALLRILADNELIKQLVTAGTKKSSQFRWENTARQVLAVYNKLCL